MLQGAGRGKEFWLFHLDALQCGKQRILQDWSDERAGILLTVPVEVHART